MFVVTQIDYIGTDSDEGEGLPFYYAVLYAAEAANGGYYEHL